MTRAFETAETIAAPPSRVWEVLTDFTQAPQWMPGLERMSGDLSLGSTVVFVARGKERSSTVTALDPQRTFALTSTQGPVTAVYTYALASVDGGTRLTLDADVECRGIMRVLAPVIRSAIAKEDSGQPTALKRLIENG